MHKVASDYTTAGLSAADRALCDYAVKLTRDSASITSADIEELRGRGLSDRAIHDAVQIIAFFNYINRVADGLGIDLEPEMPPAPEGRRPSSPGECPDQRPFASW